MDEQRIAVHILCNNPEVCKRIAGYAERCGCAAQSVAETLDALDSIEDGFGILVSYFDHIEPVHLRFMERVKQRCPKLSLVVVGEEDTAAAAVDAMRSGADYYVAASAMDVRLFDALDNLAQFVRAEQVAAAEEKAPRREHEWDTSLAGLRDMLKDLMALSHNAMATIEHAPPLASARRAGVWFAQTGMSMRDLERRAIEEALRECDRNRTRAADMLQISIRTLHRKIREYNLA